MIRIALAGAMILVSSMAMAAEPVEYTPPPGCEKYKDSMKYKPSYCDQIAPTPKRKLKSIQRGPGRQFVPGPRPCFPLDPFCVIPRVLGEVPRNVVKVADTGINTVKGLGSDVIETVSEVAQKPASLLSD